MKTIDILEQQQQSFLMKAKIIFSCNGVFFARENTDFSYCHFCSKNSKLPFMLWYFHIFRLSQTHSHVYKCPKDCRLFSCPYVLIPHEQIIFILHNFFSSYHWPTFFSRFTQEKSKKKREKSLTIQNQIKWTPKNGNLVVRNERRWTHHELRLKLSSAFASAYGKHSNLRGDLIFFSLVL